MILCSKILDEVMLQNFMCYVKGWLLLCTVCIVTESKLLVECKAVIRKVGAIQLSSYCGRINRLSPRT